MKKIVILVLITLLVSFAGKSSNQNAKDEIDRIESIVQSDKNIVIDIREEDEIKDGMIKGAKWFPLSKVNSETNWLNEFKAMTKDKNIFMYCRSGKRVNILKNILEKQGMIATNLGGFSDLLSQCPKACLSDARQ